MDALLQLLHPLFTPAFELLGSPITWTEILAFVLAVWMVICNMRVHALAWPLALISSLLYFLLFWDGKLYGEASLQLVFASLAVWGWWQWLRGRDAQGQKLRVRQMSTRARWLALCAVLAAWPLLGLLLDRQTDSPVPYWDAFPTVASLLGQYLLGRKYQENWGVWVIVNAVSVSLFAYKGYWLTVLLYAVFIPMSIAGWRAWQRQLAPVRA
ncbi:nicotinamide riboside transporter PnuC [Kinneretia asaccharophila]|uniref:Nicotinamide riboside transporter PnuC n=1 Tax=Roseateles asaccharophilus TaxID=582607 RepID=A0A4V3CJI9_9BURK|nr:nicotinamide riboside transporter PnuC [Roseateles asaccharophilus]MDN3544490.1 nicotinamide riboside transporter PnuC [Roseateles asaccharophilus]TDP09744.1 nicotinamide mononucleotide transporter [Roseateles asaccharophilus]